MNLQLITSVDYPETISADVEASFIALPDLQKVELLTESNKQEVLEFLNQRPVHTVVMASFVNDNGLESDLNRGKFYSYRNNDGKLDGVALIGHTTLIESRTNQAMAAFALIAKESETPIYVMMSDNDTIDNFWEIFKEPNTKPRLVCTEKLFELNLPLLVQNCEWNLRLAKVDEVEQIAEAHAEVAFLESGTNPLEKDPKGFMKRCLRRIEQERTFVVFENEKLVFKADIVAETDSVIYLEGIYVAPEYRGRGIASSCLSKLSVDLLERVENICMLSNVKFESAHKSFSKAGYISNETYKTIFV